MRPCAKTEYNLVNWIKLCSNRREHISFAEALSLDALSICGPGEGVCYLKKTTPLLEEPDYPFC
jgi:hypothetical protein